MKKLLTGLATLGVLASSLLAATPLISHAASANLLANPSVETATGTAPTSWSHDSWGTNNAAFTYLNTGHTGSHSVQTKITTYTSGDAKWYATSVVAKPSTSYTVSDWYQSTSASSIDAVITGTGGGTTYKWLGDLAASTTWKQASFTFKTGTNAAKLTFYHYIQSAGTLTTDDASLVDNSVTNPAPTAPTVAISSPAANATVSGTVAVTANASDAVSVKSVQFMLDGKALGSAVTAAPYSVNWDTSTATNGTHTLTAVATNSSNLTTTSTAVSVTVSNNVVVTAPTVNLSAPVNNATVSGAAVTVSANATDAKGIANVQFQVDGANIGSPVTTSPYSVTWDTTKLTNGAHQLTAIATNISNLSTTSTAVTVNVANPTAPTVSMTAPTANATVNGSAVTVSANASDTIGMKSVQFMLDNTALGNPITASPYTLFWDSTKVSNGTHTLSAIATNTNNMSTTSTTVTVTVNNPSAPSVSVTAPAANASVSGKTTTVTADASDAVSVMSVQFMLDGKNLGSAVTTAPYSVNWDTTTVVNGSHTLTAVATNSSNMSTTSTPVSVTVNNPTAPTVNITAPAANATVSGKTTSVTANASDAVSIKSVQFMLDGKALGSAVTTAPYTVNWDTTTATNGTHTLTAVATNSSNLTTTSTAVSVTVNNPTPPTVSITAPAANATVSGKTTSITASASDAVAVTSVQFKLDNNNLGSPVTTAPYNYSWDTTTTANGTHTLTAVATNSSNLSTTSTSVTVTVNNTVTPPTQNLIANPSFETASGTAPASWLSSNWGTNTSKFTYLSTGAHTGSKAVEVQTTAYTNGAANWYYNDVPVTSGKTYQYSNWYKSNVDTEVDGEVLMNDGSTQYFYLGSVFANTNWTQFKTTFTPPAGAKSIAIYQILAKVGYIISDDYSLNEYTPTPYNRALVSVTFDDGWANQYANAVPVMNQLGLKGTYYIISGELTDQPDYMSAAQVKTLFQSGNEIASHSVTHPDFTTLTAAQMTTEFGQSQTTLQNLIGAPVTDFAYPFGAYNQASLTMGSQYYASQRSVNGGFNSKDNLDVTQLKMYEVDSNVSQATVQGWINAAIANKTWLILCYHEVATTPSAPDDALYTTQPADFTAEMNYLKSTGVTTETVNQALTEVKAQQ